MRVRLRRVPFRLESKTRHLHIILQVYLHTPFRF